MSQQRVRLIWKVNRTCGHRGGCGESERVHLCTMSTQSGKRAACAGVRRGLTLVHFSAQRNHILLDTVGA